MKATRAIAAAALLAMTACNNSGSADANNQADAAVNAGAGANVSAGDKNQAAEAPANQAPEPSASGPSATASSPSSEIRALLIGRWSETGDCTRATDIREDGTFSSPGGSGRWTLDSEYLTLTGDRANPEMAVQRIDRGAMETINPQGHIGRWNRC